MAASCCRVWLRARDCSKLLQSLAEPQGWQQAGAKFGWAPGIRASCCKVCLRARVCSKLVQILAGPHALRHAAADSGYAQELQQAPASSGWFPRNAASCCEVWLGTRDFSKLLQSLARPLAPAIAASCCKVWLGPKDCCKLWQVRLGPRIAAR